MLPPDLWTKLLSMEHSPGTPAPAVRARPVGPGLLLRLALSAALLLPGLAWSEDKDWSLGFYGGQYYDSEPAGFAQGRANYLHQYIVIAQLWLWPVVNKASNSKTRGSVCLLKPVKDGTLVQEQGLFQPETQPESLLR